MKRVRVEAIHRSSQGRILIAFLLTLLIAPTSHAQTAAACRGDRVISTLVGAGLGASAAAIPATILHRHDQTSSHRLVAGSIVVGGLIGFLGGGRDQPCAERSDSASRAGSSVITGRTAHARRGALAGALIGGVLGTIGGSLYQTGCVRDPCNKLSGRVGIMLFSAGEGAAAGGLLGGLIGWAWPVSR